MRLLLASLVGVATAQDGTQCNPEYLAAIQQICCVSGSLARSLFRSWMWLPAVLYGYVEDEPTRVRGWV
eukprot:COSAG02_NODE_361_length_23829_cov_82.704509_2_plen_69_part_00